MCDDGNDKQLIELLDQYGIEMPKQFFHRQSTTDSVVARTTNHALFCIIDQVRKPISIECENIIKWIVYKQAAPQRHQNFWGYFRKLNSLIRSYNDVKYVKRLNDVYKRAINTGKDYYLFENDALLYIGCSFLRRLFILEKIRDNAAKCAFLVMGQLELKQWTQLSLVVVALCAEAQSEVLKQVEDMEKAYKYCSNVFKNVNSTFPESLQDLEVVYRIKEKCGCFNTESIDLSRVSKLMRFTEEKMKNLQAENDANSIREKILSDFFSTDQNNASENEIIKTPAASVTNCSHVDLGMSISREEFSNISRIRDDDNVKEDDTSLLSPFLFGNFKKKSAQNSSMETPKIKKVKKLKEKTSIELLDNTGSCNMTITSSTNAASLKKKNKNKKKNKKKGNN